MSHQLQNQLKHQLQHQLKSDSNNSHSNNTCDPYYYREIRPDDFDTIKRLHEELFPVKYSDSFYTDACNKIINNNPLYTCLAIDRVTEAIIGFLLGQCVHVDVCEDKGIISSKSSTNEVLYILTLGTVAKYRRIGLASKLIAQARMYCSQSQSCGAIYLHVIYYNITAIKFYERNSFEYYSTLENFYTINNRNYEAYLYIFYLKDDARPWMQHVLMRSRSTLSGSYTFLVRIFNFIIPPFAKSVTPGSKVGTSNSSSISNSSSDTNSDKNNNDKTSIAEIV